VNSSPLPFRSVPFRSVPFGRRCRAEAFAPRRLRARVDLQIGFLANYLVNYGRVPRVGTIWTFNSDERSILAAADETVRAGPRDTVEFTQELCKLHLVSTFETILYSRDCVHVLRVMRRARSAHGLCLICLAGNSFSAPERREIPVLASY